MADILQLKKSNCKNCHRCIRSCPVKSITFAESQAKVISHECILCGKCTLVCPQNAKQVRNDLTEVFAALGQGRQVIATVAPAFVSEFGAGDLSAFSAALKRLGFAEVYETAEGAEVVRKEYEAIIAERRQEVVISTCCHTVVMLVQKYYPDAVRFLAPVVSPMIASARLIKAKHPDAYVVFIGPCISKKDERTRIPGAVDCVLTFDELRGWMEQKGVSAEFGPIEARETRVSRFFPKTGGIIQSMDTAGSGYRYLAVDGVHHCMRVIEEIRAGGLRGYFIEMSACEGSCINGPATHAYREASMVRSHMRIDEFAQPDRVTRDDFSAVAGFSLARAIPADPVCEPEHTDEAITEVLAKMGKTRPEHELNCGSCGYPTCRDKARAVLNGKADLAMCLPFLIERAESFSNSIFEISPNAIFVLDDELNIQQMNASGCHLFGFGSAADTVGTPLFNLFDPADFEQVIETGNDLLDKLVFLPARGAYVELSIVRDLEHHRTFAILKDVTEEQTRQEKHRESCEKTIAITNKVVEKQMRIVQEIASLLGETTAETKIALTQIKNIVSSEEPS